MPVAWLPRGRPGWGAAGGAGACPFLGGSTAGAWDARGRAWLLLLWLRHRGRAPSVALRGAISLRAAAQPQGLNPYWVGAFFQRYGGHTAWRMLGSVMLSVTGSEALFADMGHFSYTSVTVRAGTRLCACVCGIWHLFGHLGGAGAQLPGLSDVSQHKGKRANGTRTGAETHCGSAPSSHVQQAPVCRSLLRAWVLHAAAAREREARRAGRRVAVSGLRGAPACRP